MTPAGASAATAAVEFSGVDFSYRPRRGGKVEAVAGLSFAAPAGSTTAIVGPNGCGKTTLLRAIALAIVGQRGADRLQDSFSGWIHAGAQEASVSVKLVPHERDTFTQRGKLPQRVTASLVWRSSGPGREPELLHHDAASVALKLRFACSRMTRRPSEIATSPISGW